MLAGWTVAVARFSAELPEAFSARVIGVLGLLSVGFLLFALLTSNPFDRLIPAAADGGDLNPLLQDPGLAIHPPLLYIGYVGFSVAFAFAIAAMISGDLDQKWAKLDAPLDDGRVAVPDARYRARQLVGLLRTWLGRLVVLGSGRERVVHALARRYGADPFAGGDREARLVQELDVAAGDLRHFR